VTTSGSVKLPQLSIIHTFLYAHQQFLAHVQKEGSSVNFIFNVLQQIQVLKFTIEWNHHRNAVGGKLWKSHFYRQAFEDENPYEFQDMSQAQHDEQMAMLSSEFMQFKKCLESFVTARNQLPEVYKLVTSICVLFLWLTMSLCQFGIAVLMDPFWNVNNLGIKCSEKFHALYTYLSEHEPLTMENIRLIQNLHNANCHVLSVVMETLASSGITDYVLDFIDD
jgi:hypothetical protein